MTKENNIPVIALAKDDVNVSIMILGIPNLRKVIRYEDTDDLLERLEYELRNFTKRIPK